MNGDKLILTRSLWAHALRRCGICSRKKNRQARQANGRRFPAAARRVNQPGIGIHSANEPSVTTFGRDFFMAISFPKSLRAKLIAAIGILIGVSLAGSLITLNNESHHAEGTRLVQRSMERTLLAGEMNVDIIQVQQFLTDISATRAQDGLDDGFGEAAEHAKEFHANIERLLENARAGGDDGEARNLVEIKTNFDSYYSEGIEMAHGYIDGGPAEGNKRMHAFDQRSLALQALVEPFVKNANDEAARSVDAMNARVHQQTFFILGNVIVMCLFSGYLVRLVLKKIHAPVDSAVREMEAAIDHSLGAIEKVAALSNSLSGEASSQAALAEEANTAIDSVTELSLTSTEKTKRGKAIAIETKRSALGGQDGLAKMIASLAHIKEAFKEMKGAVDEMQQSQAEASKIVKSIDDIAFQTNLLALNAAVEAARAGEVGLGFAVVADEVRSLAQRSTQASRETAKRIEASIVISQKSTQASVLLDTKIRDILEQSQHVQDGFSQLTSSAGDFETLLTSIAAISDEQALGMKEIQHIVTLLNDVTTECAHHSEETVFAAQELEAESLSMMEALTQLKLVTHGDGGGQSTHPRHDP